jgi:hypothetical protein
MADDVEVMRKLRDLGASDPRNLSAADVKVLLDAYLKNKSLNTDAFKALVAGIHPSLRAVFEGLKAFSNDQAQVAKGVLEIIRDAIRILEKELSRAHLLPEERDQLLKNVYELVQKAREEGDKNRNFLLKLAGIGGGVLSAMLVLAAAYFRYKGGGDRPLGPTEKQ